MRCKWQPLAPSNLATEHSFIWTRQGGRLPTILISGTDGFSPGGRRTAPPLWPLRYVPQTRPFRRCLRQQSGLRRRQATPSPQKMMVRLRCHGQVESWRGASGGGFPFCRCRCSIFGGFLGNTGRPVLTEANGRARWHGSERPPMLMLAGNAVAADVRGSRLRVNHCFPLLARGDGLYFCSPFAIVVV